jgi:tRNA (cytidine/uridine-2'-O-)-methyltransferase
MIQVALYQPEIPPNTGNIIRLCANAGITLHLIHPLGFDLSTKQCRRAGLDYREFTQVIEHANFGAFLTNTTPHRLFACTTKATQPHTAPTYQANDILLMGPETRGLPSEILDKLPTEQKIRIPMQPDSRSLNLSNATAIILYEGLRQLEFPGLVPA